MAYIDKQWIPFKTRFVSAWTKLVLHFNNVNTSRVEGAHSVIKNYLKVSTLDLWDVCGRLEMAMRNAVGELRAAIGSNDFKVWSDHEDGFYSGVVKLDSAYALHEVHRQMELLDDLLVASQCAVVFITTMGLPCVHTIAARKRSGGILHLGDFHKQWHLKAVRISEVSNDTIAKEESTTASIELDDLIQKVQEHTQLLPLINKRPYNCSSARWVPARFVSPIPLLRGQRVAVGEAVGVAVGAAVGVAVGVAVGAAVEEEVGAAVGEAVGVAVGVAVGDGEVAVARDVEEEEHRRLVYQCKTRRRFTFHGTLKPHHSKHVDAHPRGSSSPAGSPYPRLGAASSKYASMKHYGMSSSRLVHGRSVPLMQSPGPDFHPSIIFIDCPP
ncbi:hypothetical protein PsorP6_006705 [Peronosclerospora sorghi]|uniref:Uncharacterized protein n=1 Tax=Peronosclerospora sorghi TaxID=230839 RepID=A0ACC0W1E8_9STRA|nr:hypothetical protein PsorP6_006705 [Peronosclerospora sorghi]